MTDDDLLRDQHDLDDVAEVLDVEHARLIEEREQVEACEVAGGVVEVHVFAARIARIDRAGVRCGVPSVDRGVVLHPRIAALPGSLGDRSHERTCRDRPDDRTIPTGDQRPLGVGLDRSHELVGHANRVVGVLVLDRHCVGAVEVHVEPGVAQHSCLALLADLARDEVLDVGMVDVEDDHLRGAPRLATRLDRARRRVGTAHEADRARRGSATVERFERRTDA